jgi:hypothetical protein
MLIEDGRGRGFAVAVTDSNQLATFAVMHTLFEHLNEQGQVFSVPFSVTPSGANQCFFYLKNTSTYSMTVKRIKLIVPSTGDRIQVKVKDVGTPVGGTVITPTNLNTSSGNIASATALYGVNITGLTGGSMIDDITLPAAGKTEVFEFESGILIGPGTTMTLYAVAGSLLIRGSLMFAFVISGD